MFLIYTYTNDSFHSKDLKISKYKQESKARMPIKFCYLIFVNCGLFSFLKYILKILLQMENVLCNRIHPNLKILHYIFETM